MRAGGLVPVGDMEIFIMSSLSLLVWIRGALGVAVFIAFLAVAIGPHT